MEAMDSRMPFSYKARDNQGKLVRGRMEASCPDEVELYLERQGFFPVSIRMEKTTGRKKQDIDLLDRILPVKKQELIVFSRQLATLLDAGLPILTGLRLASEQVHSMKFQKALQEVAQLVEQGSSLSEAFASHPDIFPPLMIGMLRSGEASGQLQEIMEHLADLLEFEDATHQRIKAATRYPKLVVGALFVAFGILMTFVVPKFISMFSKQDVVLPLPTRILIQLNDIIQNHGLSVLIGLALAVYLFRRFLKHPTGRHLWDRFRLRWPVLGRLFILIAMSRFCRVLSLLLRSGVPILKAFDMVADSVGNAVITREVIRVRDAVEGGSGISEPMRSGNFFPGMVSQMVSIGEESGRLDIMLEKVADYYDGQSDHLIKNLSTYLEPLILLFLGGMVTFLALAIFLPMWSVMDLAKGGM